ncbi:MAG: L,D-transpeptidase family protein [Chloroflexota bacterium]
MRFSRRDFLKLSGMCLAGAAFPGRGPLAGPWPPQEFKAARMRGRVTASHISRHEEPDFSSPRLGWLRRDTTLKLIEEIESPSGPGYNPRWYRVWEGYIHSGYVQRIDGAHTNRVVEALPEDGQLGEISVPFTDSLQWVQHSSWERLYRLYYQSVHWATALEMGPDGTGWYALVDEPLHVRYYVPAAHVRLIPKEEIRPLAVDVPAEEKRIEVNLDEQMLVAYEGERVVRRCQVSTGARGQSSEDGLPTATPQGAFNVQVKWPSRHMGDLALTDDVEAYELPGVPWVSIFHHWGIAFHGTYWHDNFGRKMSHGCVNMRNEDAKWLYRWTTPPVAPGKRYGSGLGTRVIIR